MLDTFQTKSLGSYDDLGKKTLSAFDHLTERLIYPVTKINPNSPNEVIIDTFFVGRAILSKKHGDSFEEDLAAVLKESAVA
jgi:hypothetical protein